MLEQWFLTRVTSLTRGEGIYFQGDSSSYALYNMESFINNFTNKYICF